VQHKGNKMTIVDTRKIFDKVKREAEAAAENDDGFTMDPAKGLTVEVTKGSGKNERVETLCLSAPFEILGQGLRLLLLILGKG